MKIEILINCNNDKQLQFQSTSLRIKNLESNDRPSMLDVFIL